MDLEASEVSAIVEGLEHGTLTGATVAVATVSSGQIRPLSKQDINHVRVLTV